MTANIGWFVALLLFGLAVGVPRIRHAYFHGWLCTMRHPVLWKVPAGFAAAYGLFDLATIVFFRWRQDQELFNGGIEWQPLDGNDWPLLIGDGILPGAELLAGVFNCLVATFPVSALAAMLLLLNVGGLLGELHRTLRRRWGARGLLALFLLLACAVAAILKPAAIFALPELANSESWPKILPALTVVNALAFVFEYLLGTVLQLYLLLTAYAWVRGLQFHREKLLPFAVRRLGFVLKWSVVIIAATVVFVHLPLVAESMLTGQMTWITDWAVRPLLVAGMLYFGSMQIRLALHNDSLRAAFAANHRFLRRRGWSYAGFLLTALGMLTFLQTLALVVSECVTNDLLAMAATTTVQALTAAAAGWLLASWVCFYKNAETGSRSDLLR